MRAVVAEQGVLAVREQDEPTPEAGEVLIEVRACGICGSDLHTLRHAHEVGRLGEALGTTGFDPDRPYVMGHEFCGEVVDLGPGAAGVEPGDLVVSMPFLIRPDAFVPLGFVNDLPGGYAERMVLSAEIGRAHV